jgi:hypothetical protein
MLGSDTHYPRFNQSRFLKLSPFPHFILQWAARFTLAEYGENSFGDYVTSVGTGQFMQLIKKYWSTYEYVTIVHHNFESCCPRR